jgi:hypothetical protein
LPIPGYRSQALAATIRRPHADQRLDRPPLVHRRVGLGDAVEVGLEVEHETGVDPTLEDVLEKLRDVGANRGRPTEEALVAKEHLLQRRFHAVRHADVSDHRTRSRRTGAGRDHLVESFGREIPEA